MKKRKNNRKLETVKSGVGLNDLVDLISGQKETSSAGVFVTSRFARVLLAGSGFLADAYDLFVINLVLRLLKDEYPQYNQGELHELQVQERRDFCKYLF